MNCRLEHANVTVLDIEEAIRFLTTAFPHFRVRGSGESDQGTWQKKWVHVGTDDIYVALEQTTIAGRTQRDASRETGYNHVGFVVEDVARIEREMAAEGYKTAMADPHPFRKRLYVQDNSGLTWEFVEYLSDDPAERNDYSL
jgi:catechol 2,3-dioxygenase-like lactoylglutathione lyase family enzyme